MRSTLKADVISYFMATLLSLTAGDAHARVITVVCNTVEHSAIGNPDTHHRWELMFDVTREIVWQAADGWKPATITANKISWGNESLDRTTLIYSVYGIPQDGTTCSYLNAK
jgi:hypothetical protein